MKISYSKPPIWDEANKLFKLEELGLGTVFTYGDTLYNPFGADLSKDLIAHEEQHAKQQSHDETCAKLWWRRYIDDVDFRIEQELEAYGAQYQCTCRILKDRNKRAKKLWELATIFSGPMYGNVIDHAAAMSRIRTVSLDKKK